MRIDELNIRSYGVFKEKRLDFSKGKEGFHLILGNNEAGKSTALKAIRGLFFGIAEKHKLDFLYDKTQLLISAKLCSDNHPAIYISRRKGRVNTLLDKDGNVLEETVLRGFLNGVDKDLFEGLFTSNHMELKAGGQQILDSQGDVGKSLFSAGMGRTNILAILKELEENKNTLFKPRSTKAKLSEKILQYNHAKKDKESLELSSREYQTLLEERDQLLSDRAETDRMLQAKTETNSKLDRILRALKQIPRLEELRGQLSFYSGLPELPADLTENRFTIKESLERSRSLIKEGQHQIEFLNEKISSLTIPEKILSRSSAIEELKENLATQKNARRDQEKLKIESSQFQMNAKAIIKELPDDLPYEAELDKMERYRLDFRQKMKIQQLADERFNLDQEILSHEKEYHHFSERVHKLKAEQKNINGGLDLTHLNSSIRLAEQQGMLEEQLEKTQRFFFAEQERVECQIRQLPNWNHGVAELETLSLPSIETINRFEEAFSPIRSELNQLLHDKERFINEEGELKNQLDELRLTADIPIENELIQLRAYREIGWSLIKDRLNGEKEKKKALKEFCGNNSLIDTYEKAVDNSDQFADRLRMEAGQIARLAKLKTDFRIKVENRERIERLLKDTLERQKVIQHQWLAQWKKQCIEPSSPKEMIRWTQDVKAILNQYQTIKEAKRTIGDIKEKIFHHINEISNCLKELNYRLRDDSLTLTKALDLARDFSDKENRKNLELQKIKFAIKETENLLEKSRENISNAKNRLLSWESKWTEAMMSLGLGVKAQPQEAILVLGKLDTLFGIFDEMQKHQTRISEIDRFTLELTIAVDKEIDQTAEDLKGLEFSEAISQLQSRLKKAEQDQLYLREWEEQILELKEKIRIQKHLAEQSQEKINGWLEKLDCNEDEFDEKVRLCQKRDLILNELRNIEIALRELTGAKIGLEDFLFECKNYELDSLPGEIEKTNRELNELKEKNNRLEREIGQKENQLDSMGSQPPAAQKDLEIQSLGAQIIELVSQYQKYHLSWYLLKKEIEDYRKKSQSPVIKEASRFFKDLTLDSFVALETDFNSNDMPVFAGVRQNGQKVLAEGMSDGTLDQLYLALRLSSLLYYLKEGESLPLVLDDILINFDDLRSKAAFKLLGKISKRNQILYFTHHPHLRNIAEKNLDSSVLFVHEL
ncbi:MAG: AAA family ATPase [Deltaproteobacteria bacterium]|nr:AAA family ATPase [Deltaproteobacteria bacterium]